MATLAELIQRRKKELGLSFQKLGQAAKDAGADTVPNWHHLANSPLQEFPRKRTIIALAAALDVPVEVIAQAALESLDLNNQPGQPTQPAEQWLTVSAGGPGAGIDDPAFWVWLADNIPLESYRDLRTMYLRATDKGPTKDHRRSDAG